MELLLLPTPGPGGADVATRFASDPKWSPYTNGLPDEVSKRLADRYAEIFQVFLKHRSSITRVTFWGVSDRSSWLNHYQFVAGPTTRSSSTVKASRKPP